MRPRLNQEKGIVMVQVSVSATVSVHDGPMLPVGAELQPDSYVVSGADLDASGGADDSAEIALLPTSGAVALLALSCTGADGGAATVTVTLRTGRRRVMTSPSRAACSSPTRACSPASSPAVRAP